MSEQSGDYLGAALEGQQPVAKPTEDPEAKEAMAKLITRRYPDGAMPETAPKPKIPTEQAAVAKSHQIARRVYEESLANDEKRLRQEIFDNTPLGKMIKAVKKGIRKMGEQKKDDGSPEQEKPE